jgi:hypothetical protein
MPGIPCQKTFEVKSEKIAILVVYACNPSYSGDRDYHYLVSSSDLYLNVLTQRWV